jgi:hypothetical protein
LERESALGCNKCAADFYRFEPFCIGYGADWSGAAATWEGLQRLASFWLDDSLLSSVGSLFLASAMPFNQAKIKIPVLSNRARVALALGVIAGSLALSAASAKADITTKSCKFAGSVIASPLCTTEFTTAADGWLLGDKLFKLINPAIPGSPGALPGLTKPGHVDFVWLNPDGLPNTYEDDSWTTAIVFDGPVTGANGTPLTGYMDYTLQIVDPAWRFKTAALDSTATTAGGPIDVTVTKTIQGLTPAPYLSSIDGSTDARPLNGTFITVRDDFNVKSTGTLTSVTNTFTQAHGVPGPLPLLGAGAAFGFSRRIRSRMKGVRLA